MAGQVFKNTFAPGFGGETIDVETVIEELRYGMIAEGDLPAEVHDAVSAELGRREREMISPDRVVILLIGAMGEVRENTLLHMCAFLVDMEMYSRESRDVYTMFGWRPHKYGPHSEWFGRYVDEAIRDGLVEEFTTPPQDSGVCTGYRLTGAGRDEFDGLLGTFAGDVERIKAILATAAPEQSTSRIISYIREHYPEYVGKKVVCNRAGRGQ